MYCKNCGRELPDDANYCPSCGAPQRLDVHLDHDFVKTGSSNPLG
jgi:predicted amidophosphoribosyltransferase